jgi:hypothetical protein
VNPDLPECGGDTIFEGGDEGDAGGGEEVGESEGGEGGAGEECGAGEQQGDEESE